MHIDDWNDEFLSQFDPETYVEDLKIGRIDAPMIYIQSHVGLCYWPTKSGKMHNALKGREDLLRRTIDLCHQNSMAVVVYYSLIYNNWAYDTYPEWRRVDAKGKTSRSSGGRYGLCCPNNADYRRFIETQVKELSEYFDFEGIFMDMLFWPKICYCDSCKARWEKEVGGAMPRIVDWKDSRWQTFQKKRCDWMGEFAHWATGLMHKYKPGASVEHQYSPIVHDWHFGVTENLATACTYSGGELYGGVEQQSFCCKLYDGCTVNHPFEYMTSRCYPGLAEHTTIKSKDMLRQSVMITYAHHGACLLIDAIDPRGTLDRRVYERIGQIFDEAKPFEKVLTWGKQAFDVSIYYDLNGKYNIDAKPTPVDQPLDRTKPMHDAALGAARSLRSHHIPYGVVNNLFFDRYKEGRVLVLGDIPAFEADKVEQVLDFVRDGGSVYMSGHCSPELLKALFNLEYDGRTEESVTYISPTEAGSRIMGDLYTYDYPLAMFEPQPLVKGVPSGEVLATMTLPYTVPGSDTVSDTPFYVAGSEKEEQIWRDRHTRFASIHSNPPGIFTDRPAMVMANYGKGRAVWSALTIERPDREQHSEIFARLIGELLGKERAFNADAPDYIECVLFDAPEQHAKVLSLINMQQGFHIPPAYGITVAVSCDEKPVSVTLIDDDSPLSFKWSDSRIEVHLEKVECCSMILIKIGQSN